MKNSVTIHTHYVVVMPPEKYKRDEFIQWYNEVYKPTPGPLNGNSDCYLIPYEKSKCSGDRCRMYYPQAPRILFEDWRRMYCPLTYEIY